MRIRRLVVVLGVLAVLATGCDRAPAEPVDEPLRPVWQPPGAAGRPLLRDAVACVGRWYAVGGLADAAGETRPAA